MAQNENQEPKSKVFMLEELSDSMKKSIDNIETVMADQRLMLDILEKSEHAEHFADFIAANKKQIENMAAQHKELSARRMRLEEALFMSRHYENVEHVLELLIDALGLFKQ